MGHFATAIKASRGGRDARPLPLEDVQWYWRTLAIDQQVAAWEQIEWEASWQDPDGWQWMHAGFLGPSEEAVVLLTEPRDELTGFELPAVQVPDVLGDSIGFVVYLLSAHRVDSIVCFNDHDFVLATGPAARKLRTLGPAG